MHILKEDPDLGEHLTAGLFRRAERLLRAPVLTLERENPQPPEGDPATTFGMLVLGGLMGRRVGIGKAYATELLGPGDILRPWDHHDHLQSVPPEVGWRVFQSVRLALLGRDVTRIIGQRPELLIAFSSRLLYRARCAAYLSAVSHLTSMDEKILLTLWHLASRWGRVRPDGVEIPFRLTHDLIGEIVGAQRPTITLALNRMVRRGILSRGARHNLTLCGSPEEWPLARHTKFRVVSASPAELANQD